MRINIVALCMLSATAAALDVGPWTVAIDQPEAWADPSASHHLKHAIGGAAFGALTFTAADLITEDRTASYVVAIAGTAALAVGYELWHGRDGSAYADPVDACWTLVGGLVGAAVADLTGQAVRLVLSPSEVSVGAALRF